MAISLCVLVVAVLMIGVECFAPGRGWPAVTGWWARAIALNTVQITAVFVAGVAWDRWMLGRSVWNADALGTTWAALIGYLVITFIYYWWHRWRHEVPALWRLFHQVHHSPQRIEVITSFYKHPAEIVFNSMLSSAILYMLVGLGPKSAALAITFTGLAELVYHWNVKTPYWLGFIFQRPESHCVHHQEDWHRQNFSDLPLWDMMFGTFHNPREFSRSCGFGPAREQRLLEMLAGKDVSVSEQPAGKT